VLAESRELASLLHPELLDPALFEGPRDPPLPAAG